LSRYRLSVVPGANIGVHVEATMLVPTNGLPMQIHPADGLFSPSPIAGDIHELVEFDEAPPFVSHEEDGAASGDSYVRGPRRPR
jgi:hypothetical protein